MSNYTKGPWPVTYDNCDNGSGQWYSVGPAKVEAPYNMTALERSEWEGDVALVSACPEMLEVLENLLCLARHRGTAMLDAEDFCEIERVVKKAKGEFK